MLYKPYMGGGGGEGRGAVGFFLDRKKIDWNVALSKFFPAGLEKKKLTAKVMLFFYPKTLDISCQIFFLTFIESFHKLIGYLSLNDD